MTIKTNRLFVVAVIMALLAVSYVVGRYNYHLKTKEATEALISARDSLRTYRVVLDGALMEANELSQTVVTERQAKELALIDAEKYRKLNFQSISEVTKLKGQIKVLLDSISNDADVIIITEPDTAACAKLPFNFSENNKYLSLSGKINEKGVMSMDLTTTVDLDITVGLKRKGTPSVVVLEDNPYLTITNVSSIKVVPDKRWYDSKWLYVGAGFVGATAIYMAAK